jgi:hypothetical protein
MILFERIAFFQTINRNHNDNIEFPLFLPYIFGNIETKCYHCILDFNQLELNI